MPTHIPDWKKKQLAKEKAERKANSFGNFTARVDNYSWYFPYDGILKTLCARYPSHSFEFTNNLLVVDGKKTAIRLNKVVYLDLRVWAKREVWIQTMDSVKDLLGESPTDLDYYCQMLPDWAIKQKHDKTHKST